MQKRRHRNEIYDNGIYNFYIFFNLFNLDQKLIEKSYKMRKMKAKLNLQIYFKNLFVRNI